MGVPLIAKFMDLLRRDIRTHFDNYRAMNAMKFCLSITVEALLMSVLAALALSPFGEITASPVFSRSISVQVWNTLLLAPIGETIFLQALPIGIASRAGWSQKVQILVSLIPFALLHFIFINVRVGFTTGIVAGYYLAFAYSHWLK